MHKLRRPTLLMFLLLFLTACGAQGMAVAPELVDPDAITARAFGDDECFLILAAAVPARLNPDAETVSYTHLDVYKRQRPSGASSRPG